MAVILIRRVPYRVEEFFLMERSSVGIEVVIRIQAHLWELPYQKPNHHSSQVQPFQEFPLVVHHL